MHSTGCGATNAINELATSVSSGPVVAVDFDDVLSQTHLAAAQWHNETFRTDMDLSTFYYYHWWKNPYWGTPEETVAKVKDLYGSGRPYHAPPMPGASENVARLRAMGFHLVIVTAREKREMDATMRWLDEHFPKVFESVVCTGMPTDSIDPHNRSLATTLSKLGVCKAINAVALIDDALEHALAFAVSDPPIPVLLFGDGPWNRRVSRAHYVVDGVDVGQMSFEQRYDYEGRTEFWKRDERAAMGTPVIRVKDWGEVVKWFEERFPEKVVQGP